MELKEVAKKIEAIGEAVDDQLTEVKNKQQRLEQKMEDLDRSNSTARMFSKDNAGRAELRREISQALWKNLPGIEGLITGTTKHLRLETKSAGDMSTANLTGGTASISDPVIGPVGMAYRLNNVRDLLRHVPMSGAYLPMLKDNGGEGTLTPVSEGGDKPDIDFDLAETNAKAETIAGVTTISKQFFDDLKNAASWLTDRLVELYNSVEANQLLNGDGNTPNLKGLNTSGSYTAATGLSNVPVEQLIQGILQMRILKRRASGIIVNPNSLEDLLLNKAEGSGEYDLPNIVTMSSVGQLLVLGLPVVDVAEQPESIFTIHDNSGSLYAVRQGITIEFFNQTYAKTNKILIRIEARIAFPIFGSSYTVKGTFGNS